MLPKKHPVSGPGRLTPENLKKLKGHLSTLTLEDRQVLVGFLQDLAAAHAAKEEIPVKTGRTVVKLDRVRAVVYRQEYVRCGKEKCRCAEGQGHGPYWYAYFRSPRTGRVKSRYVGKEKKEIVPR